MERVWSKLPSDILLMIMERLDRDMMDIRRCRAVCSSWRSSIPCRKAYPSFPMKVPSLTKSGLDCPSLDFTQRTLFAVSPIQGNKLTHSPWTIQVEETSPNMWKLLHFLYAKHKSPLAPACEDLPSHINLLDYEIVEIHRSYDLTSVTKAVPLTDHETYFILLALYGNGELAFWKLGAEEWDHLENNKVDVADIIAYKGNFYVVDRDGRLMRIDMETRVLVEVAVKPSDDIYFHRSENVHMVEFGGRLYLLTYTMLRWERPIIFLSVYVLNEGSESLERTSVFGGGVFLVGSDSVTSASAKDIGFTKGDVVCFYDGLCLNPEVEDVDFCSIVRDSHGTEQFNLWPNHYQPFWPAPSWITNTSDKSSTRTFQ